MANINIVLEGIRKDEWVTIKKDHLRIGSYSLTKDDIASYEIIDETNSNKYSFWKGALGVALFGGFGAIAGIGGKKKEYLIAIEWIYPKNVPNNRSLICLDEKYYKIFVKSMF